MEQKSFLATVLQYVSVEEQRRIYSLRLCSNDLVKLHLGPEEQMKEDWRKLQIELPGKKSVEFKTVGELMRFSIESESAVDILDLDIEKDLTSTTVENENPLAAIAKAATYALSTKKAFQVSSSRAITDSYGTQFAPYCQYINLQGQALQDDREKFKAWVNTTAKAIKNENQDIRIFTQLSTHRPPIAGLSLLTTFKLLTNDIINNVDGMTIWFENSATALAVLEAYLDWYNSQPYRMKTIPTFAN
jgi:hypothetical protein